MKVIPASGYDDSPYVERKESPSILICTNESNKEGLPSQIVKLEESTRNFQFEIESSKKK